MKRKKIVVLLGSLCVVLTLVALPFMSACAAPAPAPAPAPVPAPAPAPAPVPPTEPIVLKAVSFFHPRHVHNTGIKTLAEEVNKRSNGELTIDFLGGPEVISMFDLPNAVRTGTIDIAQTAPGFYMDYVCCQSAKWDTF